ncbi:spore germination protein GerPC [Cytobacillus sp. Hz8]|uniref:spore germination protein GerPC n=1 Tax=Cytobacillus sp. Hz8 TaxID=3347168 RepID=UPI0035D780E1
MNSEFIHYIEQLHQFVRVQQKKISSLEKTVNELRNEVSAIKNRTPIHVDSIQYSFDQLKVEKLDGTLSIGLNPSDLQGIEEFAVNQQQPMASPMLTPQERLEAVMSIEDELHRYVETDIPPIFNQFKNTSKIEIDDSYLDFIKTDIKKQLPNRIENYLLKVTPNDRSSKDQNILFEEIIIQLKNDIHNGVQVFLQNLEKEKG